MDFDTRDPNRRRRVDPEQQRNRDAEIARIRRQTPPVPFSNIARRLTMSVGVVQKSVRGQQKFDQQIAELDAVIAGYDNDGSMMAVDVLTAADVGQLDELERHRLRHFAPDSPQRQALAAWTATHPQPRPVR